MGGIFNIGLLDIWNDPAMRVLRGGMKLGAKAIMSASAKADNERVATSELAELMDGAWKSNSDAQCALALHYAENRDYEKATYWLIKSAQQGNEYALEILDMLQDG